MCGKLHRDRSQDPRGKRGLCVFLSVTPSLAPPLHTLSTSVCSDSHFASPVPGLLSLIFSLSPRSFTRISLCHETLSRLTDAPLTDITNYLLAVDVIFYVTFTGRLEDFVPYLNYFYEFKIVKTYLLHKYFIYSRPLCSQQKLIE